MKRIAVILLSLAAVGLAQTAIDADNPDIRYTGRVDFTNPKRPRFDWPGVQVSARFTGTSIRVVLDWSGTHVSVLVDGDSVAHLSGGGGLQTVTVARGLADTEHEVLIVKRHEWGMVVFGGLVLDNGRRLVASAPRPTRRIEFVGDSYTTCYGCVSRTTTCSDLAAVSDAYRSYAALSARDVGAEYSLIAISGRGVVHNRGDASLVSADNMQVMFNRTLHLSEKPVRDSAGWVPQVVVIALGINDLSDARVTQELLTRHYRALIARIRNSYPGVEVLCLAFDWPDKLESWVRAAYDAERAGGNTKVEFLHVAGYSSSGCDFHPDVSGQRKIAQQLTPAIQSIFGTTPAQAPPAAARRPSAPGRTRIAVTGAAEIAGATLYDLEGRQVRASRLLQIGVAVPAAAGILQHN